MRNFIFILVILFICGCSKSSENIDIEQKYNIYISKLSNEQIEENLRKKPHQGMKEYRSESTV